MSYGYNSDSKYSSSIDKSDIYHYLTQEEIFKIAIGFTPEPGDFIRSPYRDDKNPGCFFDYAPNGDLKLIDFAARHTYLGNMHLLYTDCFDAVRYVFKLKDFRETLSFIYNKHCHKTLKKSKPKKNKRKEFTRKRIIPYFRKFTKTDKEYWKPLGISSSQLTEDKYMPIRGYKILSEKSSIFTVRDELAYCDFSFSSGNRKVYFPNRTKYRFISTTSQDDIGFIQYLPEIGNKLVITKAYKDARILRNSGIEAVYLINEMAIPTNLFDFVLRFDEIIVLFDNDEAGFKGAEKLMSELQKHDVNCRVVFTPDFGKTKDTSELYLYSKKEYEKFIHLNKLK